MSDYMLHRVTNYAVKNVINSSRPNNIGKGQFVKIQNNEIERLTNISSKFSKGLNYIGYVCDGISIECDVGYGLYNNIQAGESWDKCAYDAGVDVIVSGTSVVFSTAVGFSIGGPIGGLVDFAVGITISFITDSINVSEHGSVRNTIKSFY